MFAERSVYRLMPRDLAFASSQFALLRSAVIQARTLHKGAGKECYGVVMGALALLTCASRTVSVSFFPSVTVVVSVVYSSL
mmetsp:Transcript_51107/g.101701  ORF Transcript_51107/g.101701 Transcript_51107/m.101701 type:complete len:81 (+) Transcript_51107:457-699(+)